MNTTLTRWISPPPLRAPQLDCAGCLRPAKCCAFQPFVPNFLLGAWLKDDESLPEISNVYFHPAGAVPLPEYRMRHQAATEPGVDLLCGFFNRETRMCNLWSFRPGECSSYFCDEQRLAEGRQSVRQKSFDTEIAVMQMALVELGFSAREIGAQVDIVNGALPGKIYPGPQLLLMYKKAWNWCQTLSPETLKSWMEPA